MKNQPQQSEWVFAAELIYPAQIHALATKSQELFTALAIVANRYTAPATLAELAGLWHASNQVCEAIAAHPRTPRETLQNMEDFKYGSRARLAKETLAKKA